MKKNGSSPCRKWVSAPALNLIIVLLASAASHIRAQELDAAVTWSLNPRQGVLVIRYYPSLADAEPKVRGQNPLIFFSLVQLDTDSVTVIGTDIKNVSFQLKRDKIDVTFEPGVPNVSLLGMCGAAITGVLTVKRNGNPILTDEPFENIDCHERERRIDTITIRDGSAKPEIRYVTYEDP